MNHVSTTLGFKNSKHNGMKFLWPQHCHSTVMLDNKLGLCSVGPFDYRLAI